MSKHNETVMSFNKENEDLTNPKAEIEDMKMDEDQENSTNLKTAEQLNVNILENELIESSSQQIGKIDNFGTEVVISNQTNNKITLNLEGVPEMDIDMAAQNQADNEPRTEGDPGAIEDAGDDADMSQQPDQLPEMPVLRTLPEFYKLATPINI